ncbi:helix-turn-helix transcriptional regulator [Microlunatus soli]|uniref:Regulatory protein, luxR family n=1 Tax=Microlunatus soli TaxID=630515 RepID=A0A1H1NI03_9ACTN|nr:helix-turn-helix transcriptional regulator [Microlunatus soli]SDR98594.1 regulatory protein, luxR family [Microlunatus soli]
MAEPRDRSAVRDHRQLKINRAVRRALSDPHAAGVVVAGGVGAGKSHTLRVLAGDLHWVGPPDHQPVVVRTRTGSRREIDPLLVSCREAVIGRAGRRDVVVVADDLEQWELPALAALAHGIDGDGVRLLGAVRSRQLPQVLGALRPSRPLTLVRLAPWRVIDLQRYTTDTLGGRLQPMSARRLLDFSGGNPQCLMELLQDGRLSGRLRRRNDLWFWTGPITVPPITQARIGDELGHSGGELIDVLITLASAGPMPIRTLLALHDPESLEAAEQIGYLRWSSDGESVSGEPLAGLVALATVSTLRRRRSSERLARVIGGRVPVRRPTPSRIHHDHLPLDRNLRSAVVDLCRGRAVEALRGARRAARQAAPEQRSDPINEFMIGICLMFCDEPGQAQQVATRLCRLGVRERRASSHAAGCLLAGLIALAAARPVTAARLLTDCLPELQTERRLGLAPLIMELRSLAEQLAGRPGAAETTHQHAARALQTCGPTSPTGPVAEAWWGLDEWVDLIRSVTLDLRGERSAGSELAADVCRRARSEGNVLIELLGLLLRQRINDTEAARSRIANLSAVTQGPLLESFVEHAAALSDHDPGRLAKLAASLDRSGMLLLAGDSAVSAIAADDSDLPTPDAVAARQLVRRLSAEAQLAVPGWWRPAPEFPGAALTHREREIMNAVIAGRTSAEVAGALCLSRRTVENHLQHIYTKLGISSRAELRQVGEPGGAHRVVVAERLGR